MNCYIKERSWIARIAARKLKARSVAIVIGNTIHLYNASRQEFLDNHRWVRHELKHIRQYREHGFVGFILKYLWESIKHGYSQNKFELEAKAAEADETIGRGIHIVTSK